MKLKLKRAGAEPAVEAESAKKRSHAAKKAKRAAKKAEAAARPKHKLASGLKLFIQAVKVPMRHWEVFGGILLIYGLLNVLLIGSLNGPEELLSAKEGLNDFFTGRFGQITTGLALFGILATSSAGTAASGVSTAYQSMLLLLTSLALIWALRQVYAKHPIRVRDAFYNGMHPLIQFLLTIMVIGLQLIPATLGGFLFAILVGGGILQQTLEIVVIGIIFFVLFVASLYMLCSSILAPYIVTLPDMSPVKALRSAREVVRGRRGAVLLRLAFLPLATIVCAAVIMVPLVILLTSVAPYVYFVLSVLAVLLMHSYLYALYRELIDSAE